jgi:hypothetical protein
MRRKFCPLGERSRILFAYKVPIFFYRNIAKNPVGGDIDGRDILEDHMYCSEKSLHCKKIQGKTDWQQVQQMAHSPIS